MGSGKNGAGEGEGDTEEDDDGEVTMDTAGPSHSKSPKKPLTKSPAKSTSAKSKSAKKTKAAGSKRPRDDEEEEEEERFDSEVPAAKERKRSVCKYGPKCYQKDQRHKEKYDHPWVSWLAIKDL